MALRPINPESLGAPRGYSHGIIADASGKLLFISGQLGWDKQQKIINSSFVDQFDTALGNVIAVVEEAGGRPDQIARLNIYVTDKLEYLERTRQVGERYRRRMGKHFPAMVLIEVRGLLDSEAKVEIEGLAIL
jgi:enamine deaminase RidA (YjgF/YER057c/UK114 family)